MQNCLVSVFLKHLINRNVLGADLYLNQSLNIGYPNSRIFVKSHEFTIHIDMKIVPVLLSNAKDIVLTFGSISNFFRIYNSQKVSLLKYTIYCTCLILEWGRRQFYLLPSYPPHPNARSEKFTHLLCS